jgi:hypothetical protein
MRQIFLLSEVLLPLGVLVCGAIVWLETPLMRRPIRSIPWLSLILTLSAVIYILIMLRTGSLPETRQLVKFEAKGVLTVPPDQVRRVALTIGAHTATFVRLANATWVLGEKHDAVSGDLLAHLREALLVMHTSGPVRVIHPDEYKETTLREFGLVQPRFSVVLSDAEHTLIEAHFGAYNPQDVLQYMQITGRDEVYLMSRFVGGAWEHLGEHVRDAMHWP